MFLELPTSGLHRLFHTVPSTSHSLRETASLESLTEETHTYDLLYPDQESLLNTQHKIYPLSQSDLASVACAATSYDDRGDLDIQSSRDIRLIVAQDGNAVAPQPRVLYDSHPPASPRPPSGAGSNTGRPRADTSNGKLNPAEVGKTLGNNARISHSAQTPKSFVAPQSSSSSPESDTRSAFWSAQIRRAGNRSSVNEEESAQAWTARESREETNALLGCMFGQTGLPLVSSTKLHINPPKSTIGQGGNAPSESSDLTGSRLFPKRRTPLTRSMTAEDIQNTLLASNENAHTQQLPQQFKGPSILITRLFSADLPNPVVTKATPEAESLESPQKSATTSTDDKAKQIKMPKYGVAILIQLPSIKRLNTSSAILPQRSRLSSSHEEPHHLAAIRQRLIREASTIDVGDSAIIDQGIERIVAHWSVLTRTVSLLEAVARSAILSRLQDVSAYELALASNIKNHGRSPEKVYSRQKKYKQPSQRTIQLPGEALQNSPAVSKSASEISRRLASALKIRRVIAGQGRWGVWREEARWVSRWAGGKEQNFFLFNLLTAFLGNHTEWLETLGPSGSGYRRTDRTQRETNRIKHRTVVVSADKMAARRLVFLLSAFLPCSYVMPQAEALGRPLSSRSSTGLSRSPPTGVPIPRERSLRRTINRKTKQIRTGSPLPLHERSISFSKQDAPTDEDTCGMRGHSVLGHSRRKSEARSIRSLALPIPTSHADSRKSSITTIATLVPDSVAVPHFTSPPTGSIGGTAAAPRPGSSGSLASLSLRRTLSRSESAALSLSPDSPSASRWGSMLSGFWSTRRGSSTDHTDPMGSPHDGLGLSGLPYSSSPGTLAEMVEGLEAQPVAVQSDADRETLHGPPSPIMITEETLEGQKGGTAARDIPERAITEEFSMKLSIDTNDGVVDIDLPTNNSFSSSLDSATSSPKAPISGASSFNDHVSTCGGKSHQSHTSLPTGSPPAVDVAGFLKSYHPDFALQAVRPYKGIKEEVKASMRAEAVADTTSRRIVDEVCTTLIADTTTFSITRLTLRHPSTGASTDSRSSNDPKDSEIAEEPLMDLDSTLISAVERVIAHSQPSSVAHSRAPSPSRPSKLKQDRHAHGSNTPNVEVSPNECRSLVLGALEQVAKSVSAEQQNHKAKDVKSSDNSQAKMTGEKPDSSLREGVRRWLSEAGRQENDG